MASLDHKAANVCNLRGELGDLAPLIHNDPEHWRTHAEEARALAEEMTDPQGKVAMIVIAQKYDRLAQRVLERMKGDARS